MVGVVGAADAVEVVAVPAGVLVGVLEQAATAVTQAAVATTRRMAGRMVTVILLGIAARLRDTGYLPGMTFANTEQAEFWASRAPSWISLESHHDQIIGEAGLLAMDRLEPEPGQHIVDLGCGTGQTTVELARRVGPDGSVVGFDIATAMLERARENAAAAGVGNVSFEHADVQSSDIGNGRFDGAFSRFGVMFFADPVRAFTNVKRALKPGGRLSFACWQAVTSNEWMLLPGMAAVSVLGAMPEMPAPDAPGPFSLADPDRTRKILESAGFHGVDIAAKEDMMSTPEERIPTFVDSALRVGAVQRMLQDADPDTFERVRSAIDDAVRSKMQDGQVLLSRAIFLVRADA